MNRCRSSRLVSQICWSVVLSRPSKTAIALGRVVGVGQFVDLPGHPGRRVHAVGDRGDRYVGRVEARPQSGEHAAADHTVQLGHAVGPLGQPQPHDRHVEHTRVAAVEVLGAELEDAVDRDALAERVRREVLLDQLDREPVDPGRDRGVRGEHGAAAGHLERGVEVQALLGGELADPLDAEEAGVALVGVEHLGRRVAGDPAVGADRADTADAEQQFLEQPVLRRTAVQPVGHLTLGGVVLLHVGVEHQQRHPADLGDPDLRVQLAVAGQSQGHGRGSVTIPEQADRQPVRVHQGVTLLLPALTVQRLREVAVPVQQADTDQRYGEVAGRLQVVTGQDAQAARVLREDVGDAVFRGEVGDRADRRTGLGLEPAVVGHIVVQVGYGQLEPAKEGVVVGQLVEPGRRDLAEQLDRVTAGAPPQLRVDGLEDVLRLRVPGPAEVVHQGSQAGQRLGQDRADGKSSYRSHRDTVPAHGAQDTLGVHRSCNTSKILQTLFRDSVAHVPPCGPNRDPLTGAVGWVSNWHCLSRVAGGNR